MHYVQELYSIDKIDSGQPADAAYAAAGALQQAAGGRCVCALTKWHHFST